MNAYGCMSTLDVYVMGGGKISPFCPHTSISTVLLFNGVQEVGLLVNF